MSDVPDHGHLTVDEETYFGLLYLHDAVRCRIEDGTITDSLIIFRSEDAEERLERTRLWNSSAPNHAS